MTTYSAKTLKSRTGWALCTTAGLALCLSPIAAAAAPKPTRKHAAVARKANPPVFFGHERSDIKPDPGARFGRLANGMTYVIYKNATPPKTASVFLRINAGSMMEQEYQRGLAHFMEHMAFNGSKNVAEGEMVKLLERDGLSFGADTNAFTSQFQTVYMLNLPKAEDKAVDDALFLLRETAGNLTLDPGAIDRERGVVLGEERARATPKSRASDAETKATLPGQRYPERDPIGLTDILKNSKRPAFADFYRDFYRPEYATVIVVGDIDPDAVEAKIKAKFGDWKVAPQSANALTDYGTYRPKGEVVRTYLDKGLRGSIDVSWLSPWHERIDNRQRRYEDMLDYIAFTVIGERLSRQAKSPDTDFIAAQFGKEDIRGTATIYSVAVTPKPGKESTALTQALTAARQLLAGGITQVELDMVLDRWRQSFTRTAAGARTRATKGIASRIVSLIADNAVLTSPAQDLAMFTETAPRLTLAAVNARIRAIKLDDGPVLWAQGDDLHGFDEAALATTYHRAMAMPVPATAVHAVARWPYTQFGTPAAIVDRTAIPGMDATRITFANGVILNVKTTKFADQEVKVAIQFGAGYRTIAPSQATALKAFAKVGLVSGGLGKLEYKDIGEALNGKRYGLSFSIGEQASGMSGTTVRDDLATQMQVLMAFTTDPAFRPDPLDRMKTGLHESYTAMDSTPGDVMGRRLNGILHGDDPRYGTPSEQAMMAVRNNEIVALVKPILATAPIEITMVGDVSIDEAIAHVQATFATLPKRAAALTPLPGSEIMRFPTTDLHRVLTHKGRSDQNISAIFWPTTGYYRDIKTTRGLAMLAAIMTLRELDEIREKQGASYGVSAASTGSVVYDDYGYISTTAQVKPEVDGIFYDSIVKIVDDLRNTPVSADELLRARGPALDRHYNNLQANGFWMGSLNGSAQEPRQTDSVLAYEAEVKAITPADIQQLARTYLDMSKALRIQVKSDQAAK